MSRVPLRVGVLSDTHGLLRPEAVAALEGSDLLIHAGDVGKPEILDRLAEIAPLRAVRGNVDRGEWAAALPLDDVVEIEAAGSEVALYVLHDLAALDLDPATAGFAAVISGHSHQPRLNRRGGVLYLNPGSCGPRRFRLPVSIARLWLEDGMVEAELVELTLAEGEANAGPQI